MIIEFSFPLLSPVGSMPQQPYGVHETLTAVFYLAILLLLNIVAAATAGYIAARSSRVSRATVKGFGVGLAAGIVASVACVLALMWDEFFAAAIMTAALGTVATWLIVRKMFHSDSGD